jgi:hypothetical protein
MTTLADRITVDPRVTAANLGAAGPRKEGAMLGISIIVAVCLFACRNDGGRVTGHSTTRTPLNMSMPQAKSTVPAFAGVNSMSTGLFSGSGRLIFNEGTATSVAQV